MDLLGISDVSYLPKAGMPFHPGRSAKIVANMSTVGEIGDLHPVCLKHLDIPVPVTACWLSLEALLAVVKPKEYASLSKFNARGTGFGGDCTRGSLRRRRN